MSDQGVQPVAKPLAQAALFGREWLRAPLRVGAVAPSGPSLARAITSGVSRNTGPVLELGPGTGVFTDALLDRGVPGTSITAVEASPTFATRLAARHPEINVVRGDAARALGQAGSSETAFGLVLCGLPLLSMPAQRVFRIMTGSFRRLAMHGEFRLFTYGATCPVPSAILDRLDVASERRAFTPLNIPPASVYVLRRRIGHA